MGAAVGNLGGLGNNTSILQKAFNLQFLGLPTALTAPGRAQKSAETELQRQGAQAQSQAEDLKNTILTKPKQITPDNFLSMKAKQLSNLRLGLASTVTGAGGAPSPVLSSASLAGSYPGKSKLGQ